MSVGHCFVSAGKYLMDNCLFDDDARKHLRLVHGNPRLTRPPHIRYGHAWVEIDEETVFDTEQHKKIPRDLYYAVGRIVPEDCYVYTYEEMSHKINEHNHWGPWDLEEQPEETALREASRHV